MLLIHKVETIKALMRRPAENEQVVQVVLVFLVRRLRRLGLGSILGDFKTQNFVKSV